MQAVEIAVKNDDPKRRGSGALSDLREIEKLADGFAKKFPFADEEVDQLKQAVAKAIQSRRIENDANTDKHEWVRSNLGRLFNGAIERSLKKLAVDGPDEEINRDNRRTKERFGELWRGNKNYYLTAKTGD